MITVLDISHWQGPSIDFAKMKAAGGQAVIFKATQGRYYNDSVFKNLWGQAAGLIRGAYHYLDWTADADRQAEHFCNQIAGVHLDFPPIVDFEHRSTTVTQRTATSELWTFVKYVEDKTGRKPMIYTGPDYWKLYGSTASVWTQYPLWIANYGVTSPSIPAPWTKYSLWQFTGVGEGLAYGVSSKGIDINYYPGTLAELRTWCGIKDDPDETTWVSDWTTDPTDQMKLTRLWDAHPELHRGTP